MRARDYCRYSNVKQRRNTARRIMRRYREYETINSAVCESDNVWLRGEDGRCLCYGILNYSVTKQSRQEKRCSQNC